MKKNLNDVKRLLLTACCTLVLSCGWATVNEKPFVIPELKQWSGAEGMFTPSGKYVVKGGKNAQDVAKLFAADYHDLVGKPLTPKTGKPSAGDIVLVGADSGAGDQAMQASKSVEYEGKAVKVQL